MSRIEIRPPVQINETILLNLESDDEDGHRICSELPAAIRSRKFSLPFTPELTLLSNLFDRQLFSGGTELFRAVLQVWLSTFFLTSFPELFQHLSPDLSESPRCRKFRNLPAESIRNALEDGFNCRRPPQYYAEHFGLSLYHLNRIFKQAYGVTLNRYLAARKLEVADKGKIRETIKNKRRIAAA